MDGLCRVSGLVDRSHLRMEQTLDERDLVRTFLMSFPFSTARIAVWDFGSTLAFLPCLAGNASSSGMMFSSHAAFRTKSCRAASDMCVYCSLSLSLYSLMRSWLSLSNLAHSVFQFSLYSFCLSSISTLSWLSRLSSTSTSCLRCSLFSRSPSL